MQLNAKRQLVEIVPWCHTQILRDEKAKRPDASLKRSNLARAAETPESSSLRDEIEGWIQKHI